MASLFVHTLNDNNIPSVFGESKYRHLIDCPTPIEGIHYKNYEFTYYNIPNSNIMEIALKKFCKENKFNDIRFNRNFIPVKFTEDLSIQSFEVVMVTKTSKTAIVRDWPFFDILKNILTELNISWKDITQEKDNTFLNYVVNSKLFITLETGAAHLASQFISKENSLVIQSGYCGNKFWNFYNYDVICNQTACEWCFNDITKPKCKYNHVCMREISVETIVEIIKNKLKI